MHYQKLKKKLPKKHKKKIYTMPLNDCPYQSDSLLTVYFKKYIEKAKD